ncbi:MAG: cytochrome-c peroxidase [Raineya sp.]|nr:cytochrome-c peroxidase [Raineya sp.]
MKYIFYVGILILGACKQQPQEPQIQFQNPSNFPEPHYNLSRNPVTTEGFKLGKMLFFDSILSRDGTISCGSCHIQSSAFTQHGHDLSHGIDDQLTLRNAPPIMNLAWQKEFFWDGGVFDLDLFALAPIEAHNEMDESIANVLNKLRKHPKYPQMFERAFGTSEITLDRFLKALSQFQLMAISANSKYDKYIRNEGVTLTTDELAGLELFKVKCSSCHQGELFTDLSYRNNGMIPQRFKLNGIDTIDTGRERITLNPNDQFKFKVPSLRNVEITRPYMHNGSLRTLEQVLDHYQTGVKDHPTLDPVLKQNGKLGIDLTNDEKKKIIEFLKTLTDEEFLKNPILSEENP